MDFIPVRTASFAVGLLDCSAGCLIELVLGIEIVRVKVFVSGLAIIFANDYA